MQVTAIELRREKPPLGLRCRTLQVGKEPTDADVTKCASMYSETFTTAYIWQDAGWWKIGLSGGTR